MERMGGCKKEEYQIAVITFKIEDFDGNDLIERDAKGAVNRSTNTLPHLLVQSIMLRTNRVFFPLHDRRPSDRPHPDTQSLLSFTNKNGSLLKQVPEGREAFTSRRRLAWDPEFYRKKKKRIEKGKSFWIERVAEAEGLRGLVH